VEIIFQYIQIFESMSKKNTLIEWRAKVTIRKVYTKEVSSLYIGSYDMYKIFKFFFYVNMILVF
jgi:hypothetical protein